jgi:hypothetical protein
LRGEAAFGGGVDDEDYFSFVRVEGVGLAFFCWEGWVLVAGGLGWVLGCVVGCASEGESEHDVLSLGVKSKKVVADAMVGFCFEEKGRESVGMGW